MNKVLESLAEASSPLMVFVPRKEVASDQKFKLTVFEAASGYKLVTNLQAPKSLIADDTLKAVNASTVVSFKELSSDDSVAEMKTSEGDTVYMDIALAFDLADEQIISPITGKAITLTYASDEEIPSEEDMSEEDTTDSEDTELDMSEDDSEADDNAEDMESEDDSESDITEDMNSDEDTTDSEEDPSDETETPPSEEDVSEYQDDDFDDSNDDAEAKCKTKASSEGEDDSGTSEEDTSEGLGEDDPSLTDDSESDSEVAAGGPPWFLINKTCTIKSPFGKINLKMGDMWSPVNAKTIVLEKFGSDKEINVDKSVLEDLKSKSIRILATKHLLHLTAKSSKRGGGRPMKEAASIEATSIEVAAIDLIDTEKNIRLAALTQDGTEFAAYCGDNHIGTLRKSNASESVSGLFTTPSKLFSAFKPALQNAVKTGELASLGSFGFTPVQYSVKVSDIISKAVEQTKSKLETETAAKITSSLDRSKRIAVLSALGLLKGAFDKKLPLVTELSNVLASAGVVDSTTVVRDILSRNAESFTKAIFEQANELASNSDEYLTGLGDTIKKVQFKAETPVNNTGNLTTVYAKSTGAETASFSGVVSTPNKPTNRFSKIVRGLGSRR